ncbi:MAG: lytic transglycosylase domain-containing protein [Betaproteobacteria bacterium]|nr:lytic transglycosylase domain-containing protein [Betaproteobacteria bacterium]
MAFIARSVALIALAVLLLHCEYSQGGAQQYEVLSAATRAALSRAAADRPAPDNYLAADAAGQRWLVEMRVRMAQRAPGRFATVADTDAFLKTVHYEATRAGLDPQLVLAVIDVESAFRKFAVSRAGARGYMQVMPFWVKEIGQSDHNLFNLRTNLRYGCLILRHYLDTERGNLDRALGRYNGSLGRPDYPRAVERTLRDRWR